MHLLKSLLATLGLILVTTALPWQTHSNSSILDLSRRTRIGGGHGAAEDTGSITDLFLLHDGKSSCLDRKDTLDHWLREARALHEAMKKAYADAPTDPYTIGAFQTWFAQRFQVTQQPNENPIIHLEPHRWAEIGARINRVSAFLSGGGVDDPQVPGEKPRLFCGPDAFEYQPWGSATRDHNGKEVWLKGQDKPLPIDDTFFFMKVNGISVFWVDTFNGYDFSRKRATTICPPTDGKGGVTLARTSKHPSDILQQEPVKMGRSNRHIVFCPPIFDPVPGKAHTYESLAKAVSLENYPPPATPGATDNDPRFNLDRMMPISSTLYHELYHLVDTGNDDSIDQEYDLDNIINAAANDILPDKYINPVTGQQSITLEEWQDNNVKNPETYAFLAMSFYLRYNAPEGKKPVIYTGPQPQLYVEMWGPH